MTHNRTPDLMRTPSLGVVEQTPASRDRQLVRAAALGDAEAWDQIVETYAQLVWDVAFAGALRRDEAAAVSELVWLRLAEALPHLQREPVASWLRRVAAVESANAYLRAHPARGLRSEDGERRRQPRAASG